MAKAWFAEEKAQGIVARHTAFPVTLAKWTGCLTFRVGQTGAYETLAAGDFRLRSDCDANASAKTSPVALNLVLRFGDRLMIDGTLCNDGDDDVSLDQLTITVGDVWIGAAGSRLSFLKNGYQSWSQTRSFREDERQLTPLLPFLSVLQDNPRNLSSSRKGEFTSDMYAVIGNMDERVFVLFGQASQFRQFAYIRCRVRPGAAGLHEITLVFDFGGQVLPAGAQLELDRLDLLVDSHANRIQDTYLDLISVPDESRRELPTGWCSWYYYFTKVSEANIVENLAAAAERDVEWRSFQIDGGFETAIGDWLPANSRFPGGLQGVAERIRETGMVPGLWLAPFIGARNSRLYRDHPDWFIRDEAGRAVRAGWNPNWGLLGIYYGLDTTHPNVQRYLREIVSTIVHEFGFKYLKLDFTYGAALAGRAYDETLSPADRLRLGHQIIRQAAGDDAFILGCGCPLSPVLGLVDAMRIGPDVAPYWFARYRYHLTRDPHALCTKFAIRSILARCQMHRKLWINDPDCLLLRDADTKLTPDERFSLANAIIITGGMVVVSDRLASYAAETWEQLERIECLARECDRGRAWPLDIMEQEIPELVYNSSGFLSVFNLGDRPVRKRIALSSYLEGLDVDSLQATNVWTGESYGPSGAVLDLGEVAPHASLLLRLVSPGHR